MRSFVFFIVGVLFSGLFSSTFVYAQEISSKYPGQKYSMQPNLSNTACAKIENLYAEHRLKDIIITIKKDEKQSIDIDNDGEIEIITYRGRPDVAPAVLLEGGVIGLPYGGEPSVSYTGADVVFLDNRNYLLHYISGKPYVLEEIIKRNQLRWIKRGKLKENPYVARVLCEFDLWK